MGKLVAIALCAIFVVGGNGAPMQPAYDTIIIGLGASGTAAASALAAAGKKVLALEAQNRVGGRVNTVPFGDGLVELGAEWIHGTHPSAVYDLAVKNNVSLLPQDLSFRVYQSDGSFEREDLVNELTNFCLNVVEDPPAEPEPLGQYITRRVQEYIQTKHPTVAEDKEFINGFLQFMDLVIDNYESSNSWNDVTTASNYTELEGHQHMSWHTHGYKTLFEILLNTYNNGPGYPNLEIKLNTEVTKIQWPQNPEDNVVVSTKDGATYTANTAIVTVSLGVLKERYKDLFSPPLPESKRNAIQAISIGVVDKVVLRFDTIWWTIASNGFMWLTKDRNSVNEDDKWVLWLEGVSSPMAHNTSVTLWINGEAAKRYSEWHITIFVRGFELARSECEPIVQKLTRPTLFSPPLPEKKTQLIDVLSIGVVNKIVLLFDEVFWAKDKVFFGFVWKRSDRLAVRANDWWTTKIFGASCPKGNAKVLTVWTSGDGAKLVETLPDDVVTTKVMQVIRKFMGANTTIPEPIGMLKSQWYTNPYTRGSYTYDNVQTPQHPTARSDLAEPLLDSAGRPRLMFAGEATHSTRFSTVHGAVDTGRREAARILNTRSKI